MPLVELEADALQVRDGGDVQKRLEGIDATLSAVPYFFNPAIALACVSAGSHMCDLGGNTDVTRRVLKMDAEARAELARLGWHPEYGARPLKRVIEERVMTPAAVLLAENPDLSGGMLRVRLVDGDFVVSHRA